MATKSIYGMVVAKDDPQAVLNALYNDVAGNSTNDRYYLKHGAALALLFALDSVCHRLVLCMDAWYPDIPQALHGLIGDDEIVRHNREEVRGIILPAFLHFRYAGMPDESPLASSCVSVEEVDKFTERACEAVLQILARR